MRTLPYVNLHSHFVESSNVVGVFQATSKVVNRPFSIGIHPQFPELFNAREEQLLHPFCIAIGECGLDKRSKIPMKEQILIFEKQIEWSEKLNLPLILHCVKSWEELRAIRRSMKPQMPWIFHGFNKVQLLDQVVSTGIIPSFGVSLCHNEKLLDASLDLDLTQFFLETDDAKLNVSVVYNAMAKRKKINLDTLKLTQYKQFKKFFVKWKNG
jgi:TatD DNase family protein